MVVFNNPEVKSWFVVTRDEAKRVLRSVHDVNCQKILLENFLNRLSIFSFVLSFLENNFTTIAQRNIARLISCYSLYAH